MEKERSHSNLPVAGITIWTSIDVSIHTAMFAVHRRLIMFMTTETRELRVCRIVRMTLTASCPFARMPPTVDAEELSIVIKCRRHPCCRRVAFFAPVTEIQGHMIP
jgi:hypothetical protein